MYREPSGHLLWMIIMWLDDSNSSLLRLWQLLFGNYPSRCTLMERSCLLDANSGHCQDSKSRNIVDVVQFTGWADSGVSSKALCQQHELWACNSNLSAVEFRLSSPGFSHVAFWLTEEADSTLPSFTSECVRRCLLKAVRKWVDGCT